MDDAGWGQFRLRQISVSLQFQQRNPLVNGNCISENEKHLS